MKKLVYTEIFKSTYIFSLEDAQHWSNEYLEYLWERANSSITVHPYCGKEQLKLLTFLLKNLKKIKKFKVTRNKNLRQRIFSLIYINPFLSLEDKNQLYADYKTPPKYFEKNLLSDLIKDSNSLAFPVRKQTLRKIVELITEKRFHTHLHLNPPTLYNKGSHKSTFNQINIVHLLVDKFGPTAITLNLPYEAYCAHYQNLKLRSVLENYIVKNKILSSFENSHNPQDKNPHSMWKRNFQRNFYFNGFNLFLEDHKDFIKSTFSLHFATLEALEQFKPTQNKYSWLTQNVLDSISFPFDKPIKEGFQHFFGFHSPKLINFVSEFTKDANAKNTMVMFIKGIKAQEIISSKKPDYLWRAIHIKYAVLEAVALRLRAFKALYSEEQILSLMEKGDSSDGGMMYISDSIRNLDEDTVAEIKNNFKFEDINTWEKLHDLSSKVYGKLKYGNKLLKLEELYPSILSLQDKPVSHSKTLCIPTSNLELIEWGNSLNICVGSYYQDVKKGSSLVLGVKENNKIIACIEFRASHVFSSGFSNPFYINEGEWSAARILGINPNTTAKVSDDHIKQIKEDKTAFKLVQYKGKFNANQPEDEAKVIQKLINELIHDEFVDNTVKIRTNT